jgi:tetratricopeptide (TPR) repeat protein
MRICSRAGVSSFIGGSAQTLIERFQEVAEAEPALIAHHYMEAGLGEQAVVFLQKAGQRAVERSANLEAIAHLTKALEILKAQPETPARDRQELVLQTTVGVPLIAVKGMAAPEVQRAYARAHQLCQQAGDAPHLFPALFGLWWFYEVKPDLRAAQELAQRLLKLAEQGDASTLLIPAHRAMGHTLFWLGEFPSARRILSRRLLSTIRSYIAHWPSSTESMVGCLPEASQPMLFGIWATRTAP